MCRNTFAFFTVAGSRDEIIPAPRRTAADADGRRQPNSGKRCAAAPSAPRSASVSAARPVPTRA
ncbi:hypothetical protein TNCT1_41410 [Streptomyces sp. 1-11]|nr:hypothetical protein TNCT1_41410 [Streptomyces sp. 1-11]